MVPEEPVSEADPMVRPIRGTRAGAATLVAVALAVLVAGLQPDRELRQRRAEDRDPRGGRPPDEGPGEDRRGGRFEVQSGGAAFDLPFVMRLDRSGMLEVEAEISDGPWSSVGRVRLVSDAMGNGGSTAGRAGGRAEMRLGGQPWPGAEAAAALGVRRRGHAGSLAAGQQVRPGAGGAMLRA